MLFTSDVRGDIAVPKPHPGSYEWWYFDAGDDNGAYHIVVIFYEGCPFSLRYVRAAEKRAGQPDSLAEHHPAISISVYKHGEPVFYTLAAYSPYDAEFNRNRIFVRVGKNTLEGIPEDDRMAYSLRLEETLPDGTRFNGILRFTGMKPTGDLWKGASDVSKNAPHDWNLTLPAAKVKGVVNVSRKGRQEKPIVFEGTGYHDHNIGSEFLKNRFTDWSWGRVHFNDETLVWYAMRTKEGLQEGAWLISVDNRRILAEATRIVADGSESNGFGLSAPAGFTLTFPDRVVTIRNRQRIDSGPFYFRHLVEAVCTDADGELQERTSGISEFIKPARIHWRIFWPLVRMRLRYADKRPHWVQRFARLYRLTW